MVCSGNAPSSDESDADIAAWWDDGGHQTLMLTGGYAFVLGGLAFLAFVTLGLASDHMSDGAVRFARLLGVLVATLFAAGGLITAAVAGGIAFQDTPVDPGVARFMIHVGYANVLIGVGLSAALLLATVSIDSLRTHIRPGWLAWLGIVCAVVLLLGVMYIPLFALPLWALVTGIRELTRGAARPPARAA
ncbi:MAG: hypothetical protein ACM3S1_08680, partial [Hyphomicrobiales bacterium]